MNLHIFVIGFFISFIVALIAMGIVAELLSSERDTFRGVFTLGTFVGVVSIGMIITSHFAGLTLF